MTGSGGSFGSAMTLKRRGGAGEVAGAMELPAPDAAKAGTGGSIDEDGGWWSVL